MSGPKADAILSLTGKKKKRKTDSSTSSGGGRFIIQDEDAGWSNNLQNEEDDIVEAVVEKDRSFKKRRMEGESGGASSGWQTVREPTPPPAEDEKPVIVEDESMLEPSKKGGIMSPEKLSKMFAGKNVSKDTVTAEEMAAAQETVYRDASGRRIDTKAERAEAARKKREREELEAKKMEWGKGLVQRDEEEKRKERLEREKNKDLAVYADDKDLNEELMAKERWNDPAAAFLSVRSILVVTQTIRADSFLSDSQKKQSKGPRKPQYTGPPPPPNRFGIKPGYRWDGVGRLSAFYRVIYCLLIDVYYTDRSNGFEKKFFQKANERKRSGLESYQWSVDEM